MEQGFDFSILRWIFIIGAVVLINFFNKKPKVTAQDVEPDGSSDEESMGGEPTMKKFEELFGELFEKPQLSEEPRVEVIEEPKPKFEPVRSPSLKPRYTPERAKQDDLALSEIGSESSAAQRVAADFDLREAVIMSEILKRKYEE